MPDHDNWDEHWERYAVANSRNPAQQMRYALITKLLLKQFAPGSARVLDLGSGQGDLVLRLQTLFPEARFLGLELSTSGVELSRRKVPSATFITADLFSPPPELANYAGWATDAICTEVLEHVDSPEGFLRAARSYLADGARLVVTVPSGPMSAFDRHIGHRQHFTRESITRVLQAGGFAVERVYLSGFPFFNLYRGMVIARGERLAKDVEGGNASRAADAAMRMFNTLFRFNLMDSPLGWQVVAVGRKTSSR